MIQFKNLSTALIFATSLLQLPHTNASDSVDLSALMGGDGNGIGAITTTLDEGATKDEKLFWAVGSMHRSMIQADEGAHRFVNFVAIGVFTGVYDLAPLASRYYNTDGTETLLQDALSLASGHKELYQRPILTPEYENFSEKWGRTAINVFFDKNSPDWLKEEAQKLIDVQHNFLKEAKDATVKVLQWFKTAPQFDLVPFDLGAKSMTLMRIYTSPQALSSDVDGLTHLRELIEKSEDPKFSQFKPFLIEGENASKRKLSSARYIENKSKRIKFTPAQETSDEDFKELVDLTTFLESLWTGILTEINLEVERQDDVRGSHIHN